MRFNLKAEEAYIRDLKDELGIPQENAHRLAIDIWRHGKSREAELECHVSIFTDATTCVQGNGANFGDALEAIRLKVKPPRRSLDETPEVIVDTED